MKQTRPVHEFVERTGENAKQSCLVCSMVRNHPNHEVEHEAPQPQSEAQASRATDH